MPLCSKKINRDRFLKKSAPVDNVPRHPGIYRFMFVCASFTMLLDTIDVAREGGKDIVAVVVVHQLVRADRLAPGVVLQLGKVLASGLGEQSITDASLFSNVVL